MPQYIPFDHISTLFLSRSHSVYRCRLVFFDTSGFSGLFYWIYTMNVYRLSISIGNCCGQIWRKVVFLRRIRALIPHSDCCHTRIWMSEYTRPRFARTEFCTVQRPNQTGAPEINMKTNENEQRKFKRIFLIKYWTFPYANLLNKYLDFGAIGKY